MRACKRILAAALAAVMLLALSSCGAGDLLEARMSALVQGNLDEIYLGKFSDEYLKLVDLTAEQAQERYEEGLEMEVEYFCHYFDIEYTTDELIEQIKELYRDIYAHSSYTVGEASKLSDDTYAVKVEIRPIDVIELAVNNQETALADFAAKYGGVDSSEMTEAEYVAYDADWAQAVITMVTEQLPNLGYKDSVSIAVQIVKDSDGVWQISNTDMSNVDTNIIYYP
ncbi:MAG: hypothetical protein E7426_04460 [Ruminococcaceae bacterium]|jgi:hypothetical protein|nr:hypothetical protein [Oscillospiraceae bacterium]